MTNFFVNVQISNFFFCLLQVMETERYIYLVMEYAPNGEIFGKRVFIVIFYKQTNKSSSNFTCKSSIEICQRTSNLYRINVLFICKIVMQIEFKGKYCIIHCKGFSKEIIIIQI